MNYDMFHFKLESMFEKSKIPFFLFFWVFVSCAQPTNGNNDRPEWKLASVDDPDRIEIVTWNIQNFPKSGDTIDRLQAVLDSLHADIYCFQEIQNTSSLLRIFRSLPDYDVVISSETSIMHLVIAWQKAEFTELEIEDMFTNYSYYFASRPPIRVKFRWNREDSLFTFNVLSLHMKAMGDASSRERRRNASNVISLYLRNENRTENPWILAGDWNDDLTTSSGLYSFGPLLDYPEEFMFVTRELAADPNYASYPGWPSFIDNIMVTKALFESYENSTVTTLRLDKIFSDYFQVLSDHRPVMWQFSPY
ncbi:MAG TPA: hypothetical protein ENO01_02190 [Candidatus Marinimicrobia bacterium]|nr:hypothetical protein [Candidatus Neomarinimicrobiota bacterium]